MRIGHYSRGRARTAIGPIALVRCSTKFLGSASYSPADAIMRVNALMPSSSIGTKVRNLSSLSRSDSTIGRKSA